MDMEKLDFRDFVIPVAALAKDSKSAVIIARLMDCAVVFGALRGVEGIAPGMSREMLFAAYQEKLRASR